MSFQEEKLNALLNAYVDGLINEKMRGQHADYLESDPNTQLLITQFSNLDIRLRSAYSHKLNLPSSNRLQQFVEDYKERGSNKIIRRLTKVRLYLNTPTTKKYAGIILLCLLLTYLLALRPTVVNSISIAFSEQIKRLAQDAYKTYSTEKQHAVEVSARNKTHLIKWLSKRLGANITPVNLKTIGYRFIGGRLLPSAGKSAALYMYADKDDRRLILYIRANESAQTLTQLQCDTDDTQVSICSWHGRKMMYFLIGPEAGLKHIAVSKLVAAKMIQ